MAQSPKPSGNGAVHVGRPRASGKETSGDSRRDILMAAGKLFRQKGFAGTSLREIGEEAGLRKASLYYYFKSKDDMLVAMIEEVMAPALTFIRRAEPIAASPAAKLWAYLFVDTRQLCLAPFDYTWFLVVSETRSGRFQFFWDERTELLRWIEDRLREGGADGVFSESDPAVAARAILSLDEYAVNWSAGSGESPDSIAGFVADFALRATLKRPEDLADVREQGQALVKQVAKSAV